MAESDLHRRIEELEARLQRLERRLGEDSEAREISPPLPVIAAPPPLPEPSAPTPPVEPPPLPATPPPLPTATPAAPPTTPTAPPTAPPTIPAHGRAAARVDHVAARKPDRSLEAIVGGRLFAWIGAVAIVIGLAFFLKVAVDKGWWGALPESVRCAAVAVFGAGLIAAGEIALRRVGRLASVGLFAAGLAALDLAAWAASGWYDLVSTGTSFALMALVAAIGIAVTLRARLLTIGVLALLAGYATPGLLGVVRGMDHVLLVYLTTLLGTGLALSALRPRPFRALRFVAMGAHLLVAFVWLVDAGRLFESSALVFMSVWWGMVLVESTWSALRGQSRWANITATLLATGAYVSAGAFVLMPRGGGPSTFDWTGIFTAMVGVASGAAALHFGPGLDALRRPQRRAMDMLAVALWAQCGILLATGIALHFDGFGQVIGWLALAVASVELARRLPSRGIGVFGLVVGALAVTRTFLFDSWAQSALDARMVDFGLDDLRVWALLALAAIAATVAAAQRLGRPDRDPRPAPLTFRPWRHTAVLLMAAATIEWLAATGFELGGLVQTAAWALGAVLLLVTARFAAGMHQPIMAVGVLGLTAARWGIFELVERYDPGALVLLNGECLVAAFIVAVAVWAARCLPDRGDRAARQLVVAAAALFALFALCFEVDRGLAMLVGGRGDATWAYPLLLLFACLALAAAGGVALLLLGRRAAMPLLATTGWIVVTAAALTWLTAGALAPRLQGGPVADAIVLNPQFGAGVAVAVGLAIAAMLVRADDERSPAAAGIAPVTWCVAALVVLVLGSLEIDRAFVGRQTAVQTGLSIWWAVAAIATIVFGFARRMPAVRYAGLALFGVTALKVFVVDLSQVETIWRVVSAMMLGLLLVATSILYARLSPRLEDDARPRSTEPS